MEKEPKVKEYKEKQYSLSSQNAFQKYILKSNRLIYLKNVIQLNNELKNTIHYADFTQFRHINECSKKKKKKLKFHNNKVHAMG